MSYQNIIQSLKKRVINNSGANDNANLERLRGLPFYCLFEYGRDLNTPNCCINHVIGLPKDSITGEPKPLYQWQKNLIIDNLQNHKLNWLKKATGIGASELTLRWILFQSLTNEQWQDGIVCLLTGPNWDLSKRLIQRLEQMAINGNIPITHSNDYKIFINNIEISSFPSHNISGMRSLINVKFILLDEADYFGTLQQQQEVEIVVSRYVGKTDCSIFMVSTPNSPAGLFARMQEHDTNYHKTFIDYSIPLGTLFSEEMIAKARLLPSWDREYALLYTGGIGDIYNINDIEATIQEYDLALDESTWKWCAIDPAFGSSDFAIMVMEWKNQKLQVIYCENIEKPKFSDMVRLTQQLHQKYNFLKIFVDASATAFVREIKSNFGEYSFYDKLDPKVVDTWITSAGQNPLVAPVSFNKWSKHMTQQSYKVLSKGLLRINPKFQEFIISLRTARSKGEWEYDKSATSTSQYMDICDCWRMLSLALQEDP
jgi:hypothetical protein